MNAKVLLIDEEQGTEALSSILKEGGFTVLQSGTGEKALEIIREKEIDAVITDFEVPTDSGIGLFDHLATKYPDLPVIYLSALGSVETAVEAMSKGAFYYFVKPPDYSKLKGVLFQAVKQHRSHKGAIRVKARAQRMPFFGKSRQMRRVLQVMEAVKDSTSNILIQGEPGTGKEVVARAVHSGSFRKKSPFMALNCAGIPAHVIERQLFGPAPAGSADLSNAMRAEGIFQKAKGGTIFLDSIDELELSIQARLMRVLQEREISEPEDRAKFTFRLVSSTSRNLGIRVRDGSFREDLLYRINTVEIRIPSLKERKDDLPFFISGFMKEFCEREGKGVTISGEAMDVLLKYNWPGNIRQLRDALERAVIIAGEEITLKELPSELNSLGRRIGFQFTRTLKEIESQAVRRALNECRGNKSRAARLLGISRKAFYKRLKQN